MSGLFFSLLNLFNLALLVRLTLPQRYVLLNPYAAALDNLLARLFRFVQPAFQLPVKGLCGVLLGLSLAVQAVMLARQGEASLTVNVFAIFAYTPKGFTGWLLLSVLKFFGFYVALLAATLFLRVWHRGRALPGYTGDLILLAARPLAQRSMRLLAVGTCCAALVWVILLSLTATSVSWPLAADPTLSKLFAESPVTEAFNLAALPEAARLFVLTVGVLSEAILQMQSFMILLFIAHLVAQLLRSQSTVYFLTDAIRLLTGALPPMRLGVLSLAPLVACFLFGLIANLLSTLALLLAQGFARVV